MADEEKGIDALHAQWTAEDGPLRQLAQDVWALHHRRAMFNGLVGMLEGQGNPHRAYVEGFLAEMYFEAQLVRLRRLIDADSRTVSFRRLINQLLQHRSQFTREWYVDLWTDGADAGTDDRGERLDARSWEAEGSREFDRWTDDRPDRHDVLGVQPLRRLLDALVEDVDEVKAYVDQRVAHAQKDPDPSNLTYGQVDRAIARAGETLQTLSLLLEQVTEAGLVPTVQGDWRSPFRAALVDCGDEPIPWDDPCWRYRDGGWRSRSEDAGAGS